MKQDGLQCCTTARQPCRKVGPAADLTNSFRQDLPCAINAGNACHEKHASGREDAAHQLLEEALPAGPCQKTGDVRLVNQRPCSQSWQILSEASMVPISRGRLGVVLLAPILVVQAAWLGALA